MDDRASALRNRPRPPSLEGGRAVPRRASGPYRPRQWSKEPHHRRRRGVAYLTLLAIPLVVAAAIWASSGPIAAPKAASHGRGFFTRLGILAGLGPGSFASAEEAAANAAVDRTLTYTPYVRVAGAQHREIALTFDDGPGPYTPRVLSILEHQHVPGTFFEVGVLERYFHASTSEMVAHGFPIGDHTESHAPMGRLTASSQEAQLLDQPSRIGRYGAPFPRLFRPPYGLWNSATLALLHQYRMLMVLWTVDTSDYRRPGVAAIVHSALAGARPGAIILLHDAGGDRSETVAALPRIIAGLRGRGYQLVTVPKLLLDNPAPRDQKIRSITGSGG